MSDLWQQFLEDRALRDAARANFLADLEHAKESFSGKGVAERIVDRIGDGARDVFEQASETAEDNRGIIAALIGAILLWLSRGPIMEMLGFADPDLETDNEGGGDAILETTGSPPPPLPPGEDDD
ncbi:hypothetical protein [Erythrobacter sp. THAF29]|uniref:hypothetical protein n=1 Tax=Erythrobacter sp. THAF29 TaxID=2587851 RepID=UPI00126889D9|nr:hypothetical protein [Erythrobacter sp. THAF29]QFT77814.1 hypothetical protein FIU90_09730 [Erythrobacter sp. THAF29]